MTIIGFEKQIKIVLYQTPQIMDGLKNVRSKEYYTLPILIQDPGFSQLCYLQCPRKIILLFSEVYELFNLNTKVFLLK